MTGSPRSGRRESPFLPPAAEGSRHGEFEAWSSLKARVLWQRFRIRFRLMNKFELTFPEILFIGLTHLVLGAGLSLLVSDRLGARTRRGIGRGLVAAGIATAVPRIAILARGKWREEAELGTSPAAGQVVGGARIGTL